DSTFLVSTVASAFKEVASAKWGRGLRSLPSAAISAKVCPEPANRLSAESGLKTIPAWRPGVSLNSSPARSIEGWLRFTEIRDQGISIEAGFNTAMAPIAPAALQGFQRSRAV